MSIEDLEINLNHAANASRFRATAHWMRDHLHQDVLADLLDARADWHVAMGTGLLTVAMEIEDNIEELVRSFREDEDD